MTAIVAAVCNAAAVRETEAHHSEDERSKEMHVYVQTNDADANEVIVFRGGSDGRLERSGAYATGGKGTGKPHLASQSSVVLAGDHLFVANAGSDEVSVFAIEGDGLRLRNRVASGGSMPTSIAVHRETVAVLNAGGEPNVSVFELDGGKLATCALPGSDPAQVAFSPDGQTLVVTDRATDSIHAFTVEKGRIADRPVTHASSGATPYGFDFTADGKLIVTEAAGAQVGKASASSYVLAGPAKLDPISGPIGNTRSEVCWAVIGKDGRFAYVTNFGDGTISTYEIASDGSISLRDPVAARTYEGEPGLRDEGLSEDGRFLYALHADRRRIFAWEVGEDGSLAVIGGADDLPATAAGLAVG
jgi:6-phosphogluconolactonase